MRRWGHKHKSNKYSPEVRERAVRMVQEHRGEYPSLWAAVESIAPKIGCVPQTLQEWVKREEVDSGARPGVTTAEAQRVKELEREVRELRRANEILKLASAFFAQAELDRRFKKAFIDEHRDRFGVEPICRVLQIAPSGYRRRVAVDGNPALRSARAKRDAELVAHVKQVWQAHMQVYGADKVWKPMNREGTVVARCTVERLMRRLGLRGMMRGHVMDSANFTVVRLTGSRSVGFAPTGKRHFSWRTSNSGGLARRSGTGPGVSLARVVSDDQL